MPANALVLITVLVMAVVVVNVALIVSQADIHPNATLKILARKKCAYGAREIHRDNTISKTSTLIPNLSFYEY